MLHDELEKINTYLKSELVKLRAGRASIDLVENIKVEAYDTQMPLNQLATLSVPEPRLVLIQPWDRGILKNIEKALRENLPDFNPVVDGGIIRIPFPAPTEERRKELVKESAKIVEGAKIKIRRVREDAMSEIEERENRGEISEDDLARKKDEVQTMIDKYNLFLEEAREKKDKEIKGDSHL